jgi:hypothetical protein
MMSRIFAAAVLLPLSPVRVGHEYTRLTRTVDLTAVTAARKPQLTFALETDLGPFSPSGPPAGSPGIPRTGYGRGRCAVRTPH